MILTVAMGVVQLFAMQTECCSKVKTVLERVSADIFHSVSMTHQMTPPQISLEREWRTGSGFSGGEDSRVASVLSAF